MVNVNVCHPPNFGSVQFYDFGDGSWRADITDAHLVFWRYWSTFGTRSRLTKLGFKLCVNAGEDGDEDWFLEFRAPADLNADAIEKVIAATNEEVSKLPRPVLFGEPLDEAQRRQHRQDLDNERSERQIARHYSEIEIAARDLLAEYGEFASDRPLLRQLLASRVNWPYGADKLVKKAREKTEKRAAARLAKARIDLDVDGDDALGWTDDEVIRAVKFLTSNDFDHAAIANDRGWSSADSAAGHWCAKMLKDPEHSHIALATARGLVGKYVRQLVTAGIVPRDRVLLPPKQKRKAA